MSVTIEAALVKTPNICGGRLRIDGTRITVYRIATLVKQGQTAKDIAQTYPHLSDDQIYAALTYYHNNKAQIESELAIIDSDYDQLKDLK